MELYILDSNLTPVAIIDNYKSLIWTTRYFTSGDFELYLPADNSLLEYIKPDYFVVRDDDTSAMVIEKIEIKTSIEDGDFFIITGNSLESILARRIIWKQTNISVKNPVAGINQLITENAITTTEARKIPKLSVSPPISVSGELSVQFTGTNLLTAITEICVEFGLGIKIILSDEAFQFSCYQGQKVDVIFSPEFDNLLTSDYVHNLINYRNCGVVAGEGEGTARKKIEFWNTSTEPLGLTRRELYVDARDLSTNEGEISEADYISKLQQRGNEKLNEFSYTKSFETEIEPTMTYQYKVDYNLGDIVTITNKYGISEKPRIIEIIESWNDEGYKVIPTFEEMEAK